MEHFRRRSSTESPNRLGRAVNALRKLSPHRRSISEDIKTEEDHKGPLGLNLLWDVPEPQIDFIFIHGLGGGSRKTWSANSDPELYWPKAWLSQEPSFGCVRIHSFGYAADWGQKKESFLGIRDFARSLINDIHCSPELGRSKTKVVLVAHSMGGIVAKKAFMSATEDLDFRELADRIHTIYFLATPHRGSDLAGTLDSILKVSYPKSFVPELKPNSEAIASINDSFRHVSNRLKLWSFYEKEKTTIVRGLDVWIVDESSATLGYGKEKPVSLQADHRNICKFRTKEDYNYKILRNNFVRTINDITTEVSECISSLSRIQNRQLAKLTGVSESPRYELAMLEEARAPQSCTWISTRQSYITWRGPDSSETKIFWLTGNAGFGKSFLSSYVINDIQTSGFKCSYFFFKKGVASKSTIADCLRSIAYQMAAQDEQILTKLLASHQTDLLLGKWDEKIIWRALFVDCIFMHLGTTRHTWIIDALDECHKSLTLVSLLAHSPSSIKIFLTSRNQGTNESVENLKSISVHYQMQLEDTLRDFVLLVRSKMHGVPIGDVEARRNLETIILSKASGSFLWISLVMERLEKAYSEEEVQEILNEIPTDMSELYAKTLEELSQNPRAVKLAGSIFRWTLLSSRPLKVEELQICVKLDVNHTIHKLEKSISTICGQLVCVNSKCEVEIIHETAKAYLVDQTTYHGLVIEKQEDHARLAQLCLEVLLSSFPPRSELSSSNITDYQNNSLLNYASGFFSDHLQKSSARADTNWDFLCRLFLRNSVLGWIEYCAANAGLGVVLRTAKNLQSYLKRRIKYLSPLDRTKETMAACIRDLAKLTAKFGAFMTTSPSSIQTLIPSMCPSHSFISNFIENSSRGLILRGHKDENWDDCLVRVDYPESRATALAVGLKHSAVGMANGTIFLYCEDANHQHHTLNHGERTKVLTFSAADEYLASGGLRSVKVWSSAQRVQLWSFETQDQALSLSFLPKNVGLIAATEGNYTLTWQFAPDSDVKRWNWNESICEITDVAIPLQQPGKACFSLEHSILAVSYRGLPIYLFNVRTSAFLGCCKRENSRKSSRATTEYGIDAMTFNTSPEINVLISSYGDGELVVFDVQSTELRFRSSNIFAHCLATSPDSKTLVTGSSGGTIQLFEFGGVRGDKLSLIYRIEAYDVGITATAFTGDSLRFADIRGSQYRVWEPDLLVSNEFDEGSLSDLSQAVTLLPKSTSMLEGPPDSELTTLCVHPNEDIVFAGKQDGTILYFDIENSDKEGGIICRHATHTGVTAISFVEHKSILITADESGRVMLNTITINGSQCRLDGQSELQVQSFITAILCNPTGDSLLIQGRAALHPYTIYGDAIIPPVALAVSDDLVLMNHPVDTNLFAMLDHQKIHYYTWTNATQVCLEQHRAHPIDKIALSTASRSSTLEHHQQAAYAFNQSRESSSLVVYFSKPSRPLADFPPRLRIFTKSTFTAPGVAISSSLPDSLQIVDFSQHCHQIREIIAVFETTLLFLDTSHWVCSIDLLKSNSFKNGAKRHFFLLSEWQDMQGRFTIAYLKRRKEIVVARRGGILVFGRLLNNGEAWIDVDDEIVEEKRGRS